MTEAVEKRGPGPPTLYRDEYVGLAKKLCLLGARDVDVAAFFDVSKQTIYNWQEAHPEFREAMRLGKIEADMKVAESLYRRACGTDETPPDTTACIFWLKNRRPDMWRDKQDVEHSGNVQLDVAAVRERVKDRVDGISNRLLTNGNGGG